MKRLGNVRRRRTLVIVNFGRRQSTPLSLKRRTARVVGFAFSLPLSHEALKECRNLCFKLKKSLTMNESARKTRPLHSRLCLLVRFRFHCDHATGPSCSVLKKKIGDAKRVVQCASGEWRCSSPRPHNARTATRSLCSPTGCTEPRPRNDAAICALTTGPPGAWVLSLAVPW